MKKTVLKYGLLSAVTVIMIFIVSFLAFGVNENYQAQEILGYASIILSLLFVFFGIKHYRDHVNKGRLTFGQGMKLGILIVLIPSLAFGLFDLVYVTLINPEFADRYYEYQLNQMKLNMKPEEFQTSAKQMAASRELFKNPLFNFLLMTVTVFILGVIVTTISSLILMKKEPKTA